MTNDLVICDHAELYICEQENTCSVPDEDCNCKKPHTPEQECFMGCPNSAYGSVCIPVEQPAPESPVPLDLVMIRRQNKHFPPSRTTTLIMCDEIEQLRIDLTLTQRHADWQLDQIYRLIHKSNNMRQQRDEARVKLAKLNGLFVAAWLERIARGEVTE